MKFIIIAASLLSTSALADSRFTVTTANGDIITSRCTRSFYTGTSCTVQNSADMVRTGPVKFIPNTNPEWGAGCRSCDDASKERK